MRISQDIQPRHLNEQRRMADPRYLRIGLIGINTRKVRLNWSQICNRRHGQPKPAALLIPAPEIGQPRLAVRMTIRKAHRIPEKGPAEELPGK